MAAAQAVPATGVFFASEIDRVSHYDTPVCRNGMIHVLAKQFRLAETNRKT